MDREIVWLWYVSQKLGKEPSPHDVVPVSPWRAFELLFVFHPLFTPRMPAIAATAFSEEFDDEADTALFSLAAIDNVSEWEKLSSGAWRVLQERLVFVETVALTNAALNEPVFITLPRGLDETASSRTLLLRMLLGPGRTIDRRLLARSTPGTAPTFPAATTLRRQ